MVWGAIGVRGVMAIAPVKGHIDSNTYQDIITDYLLPSVTVLYPDGFVLQQENADRESVVHCQEGLCSATKDHFCQRVEGKDRDDLGSGPT